MSVLEEYLELVRAATAEIESLRQQLAEANLNLAAVPTMCRRYEARLAEAEKANQLLRADLAAAAREEDLILAALRLDPERYRTECGYLNVPKIVAAIKNPDMYPRTADSASAVQPERCCLDYPRCDCNSPPEPDNAPALHCPHGYARKELADGTVTCERCDTGAPAWLRSDDSASGG